MATVLANFKVLISKFTATFSSAKNLTAWIIGVIIFFILLFRWGIRKIISFIIVVGITLLILTVLETLVLNYSIDVEEGVIASLLRICAYLFIVITLIYYSFMKP